MRRHTMGRPVFVTTLFAGFVLMPVAPVLGAVSTDGFESRSTSVLTLNSGVVATSGGRFTPAPIVVKAAGDIACDPADVAFNRGLGTAKRCRQMDTSKLLGGADNVFAIGDTQYMCGGGSAYRHSYGPSWGRFKTITWAIPADQEYAVTGGTDCGTGAAGYYNYFGARGGSQGTIPGVYSFDLPEGCTPAATGDCTWHIVGLNSVCLAIGGCANGSPMEDWLDQDLTDNGWAECTAVMLHLPRYTSKANGINQLNNKMLDIWQDFVAHRVEFVLSGNSHYYERFAPQDALGEADPNGTVQWIVGTGGKSLHPLAGPRSRLPNSQAATRRYGVLRLALRDGSYGWRFMPVARGTFSDTGSRGCV